MSQNAQKLYSYLQDNEPNFDFGNFDEFRENLKDPNNAEKLRNYLNQNNEIDFGDSASFYDDVNKTEPKVFTSSSDIQIKTIDPTGDDLLNLELNQKDSSETALKNIDNPADYENNQKVHSTDYGLFQINDLYHDKTSQDLFGKGVGDLSPLENIELASIISKNTYGPSNWVAYKKGAHKQFEGITDEDMITKYGVSPEVINSINEEGKFLDPQLYKQILLAESAGKSNAIKVNYTPQEDGKEIVPQRILRDTEQIVQNIPMPEPMVASSTDVVSPATEEMFKKQTFEGFTSELRGTQLGPATRQLVETGLRNIPILDTSRYEDKEGVKEVVDLGVNFLSTLAEMPGGAIDISTNLLVKPEETVVGLLKMFPEEFNNLMLASNVVDVINPFLGLFGKEYSEQELSSLKNQARQHIFKTAGLYTAFTAHGLTRLGKTNSKIIEKNKEFRDVVDIANDKPVKNVVTDQMLKDAKALKENVELKRKAEQIQTDALITDYIEGYKQKQLLEKADKVSVDQLELQFAESSARKKGQVSTELDLTRDIPVVEAVKKQRLVKEKANKIEESVKKIEQKTQEKSDFDKRIELETENVARLTKEESKSIFNRFFKGVAGIKDKVYKSDDGASIKILKETKKSIAIEVLDGPNKGFKRTIFKRNMGARGSNPSVSIIKDKNIIETITIIDPKIKTTKKTQKQSPTEIVQEIKLKTSKDLNKGKDTQPIKNEPARRYKTKEKVDDFIEQKLSEYVGQNIIARYGKTAKGDYLVKIFEKTKEQPLPVTATKPKPRNLIEDSTPEVQPKMRDPRASARRIQNKQILAEKYELEISELNRSISQSLKEIDKLREQSLSTGVQSPRIELLKNSIDTANKVLLKSQNDLRNVMSPKQLVKRITKNISTRTAKGSVGRNIKKTQKERIEQQLKNQELVADIKKLFELGETGLRMTKDNLLRYLKDINAPMSLRNHVKANYKELYDTATVQNAKELALEIDAKLPQSQGAIEATKTATRTKEEYFNNIRVDLMSGDKPEPSRLPIVELVESMVENIGGEKATKAKGTRGIDVIKAGAEEQNLQAKVAYEVLSNKLAVENLPEKFTSLVNQTGTSVLRAARTKKPNDVALAQQYLQSLMSYISEPARTVRTMRDATFNQEVGLLKKYTNEFGDFPEIQQLLLDLSNRKEVKRSALFKVAEWGRNMKLATGSSLVRSFAGNTIGTLDAYARLPFEFGFDYVIANSSKGLYRLSNGQFGNLSKNQMNRLEIGAQFNGHVNGFRGVGDLLYNMFIENDAALRKSTFFKREGFTHKDIKGKKGVVIRTGQRLQGMADILFRVPLTNGYMNRNAIRQAIKEGYKTEANILQRASEIMKDKSLEPKLLKEAISDGEYPTFQRELGKFGQYINKMRTGNTAPAAVAQMLVPFYNTATNLFKYTIEHTPFNLLSSNFRKAFKEAYSKDGAGSRALSTELGKMSSGLGAMYLINRFILEKSSDNITGDWSNISKEERDKIKEIDDLSKEERDMRTVNGEQEYAVKTADGNWVSYRGFEPISSYLTLLDAYLRISEDDQNKKENIEYYGKVIGETSKELLSAFLENPFFGGTGDLFKVLNGRKDAVNFFFNFTAGMAVPGTVRQLQNIINPNRTRKLKLSDIDENVNLSDVAISQAKGVFPWFVEGSNLPALDPFGRVIPFPDAVGGLYAMRETIPKNDPVYNEIQTVFFERDKSFKYASPFYTASELAKINLTPEEHFQLIKKSGQELYKTLDTIIKTDNYKELSLFARYTLIKDLKNNLINIYRKQLHGEKYEPIKAKMSIAEMTDEVSTDEERLELLKELLAQ